MTLVSGGIKGHNTTYGEILFIKKIKTPQNKWEFIHIYIKCNNYVKA